MLHVGKKLDVNQGPPHGKQNSHLKGKFSTTPFHERHIYDFLLSGGFSTSAKKNPTKPLITILRYCGIEIILILQIHTLHKTAQMKLKILGFATAQSYHSSVLPGLVFYQRVSLWCRDNSALLCMHMNAFHQTHSAPVLSSGEMDDWDRLEVRPGQAGVQNFLYLNDEEEEEEDGEEVEQGQEGRKVTVRNTHKHDAAVVNIDTYV